MFSRIDLGTSKIGLLSVERPLSTVGVWSFEPLSSKINI